MVSVKKDKYSSLFLNFLICYKQILIVLYPASNSFFLEIYIILLNDNLYYFVLAAPSLWDKIPCISYMIYPSKIIIFLLNFAPVHFMNTNLSNIKLHLAQIWCSASADTGISKGSMFMIYL